ncbi:MAG TPA: hypothetical protein DEA08_19315, partial [Planctomycetes bacterium]|nr:hypothetical protein [Planctomycetota bacterium]
MKLPLIVIALALLLCPIAYGQAPVSSDVPPGALRRLGTRAFATHAWPESVHFDASGETLLITTRGDWLYAFDARSGRFRWRVRPHPGGTFAGIHLSISQVVCAEGRVATLSHPSQLVFVFDLATGRRLLRIEDAPVGHRGRLSLDAEGVRWGELAWDLEGKRRDLADPQPLRQTFSAKGRRQRAELALPSGGRLALEDLPALALGGSTRASAAALRMGERTVLVAQLTPEPTQQERLQEGWQEPAPRWEIRVYGPKGALLQRFPLQSRARRVRSLEVVGPWLIADLGRRWRYVIDLRDGASITSRDFVRVEQLIQRGDAMLGVDDLKRIVRWELGTRRPQVIREPRKDSPPLRLSPDGSRVYLLGTRLEAYDLASGERIGGPRQAPLAALAVAGELLAAGDEQGWIRVWRWRTGHLLGAWATEAGDPSAEDWPGKISSLAFSPDGGRLVCAKAGSEVEVWSLSSSEGRLHAKLLRKQACEGSPTALAISPDGALVAHSESDAVRVWTLTEGRRVAKLEGLDDPIDLAFSPDGKALAVASQRGHPFTIFDLARPGEPRRLGKKEYAPWALGLAWSPEGGHLYGLRPQVCTRYDLVDRTAPLEAALDIDQRYARVPLLRAGRLLAIGGERLRLHGFATLKERHALSGHSGAVRDLALASEQVLASASEDGSVLLWDLSAELPPPRRTPERYPFLPSPSVPRYGEPPPKAGPSSPVRASRSRPRLERLLTRSSERVLALVRAGERAQVVQLSAPRWQPEVLLERLPAGALAAAAHAPSGRIVIATLADLRGYQEGKLVWRQARRSEDYCQRRLAFSPDGSLLAEAESFGRVRWSAARDGRLLGELQLSGEGREICQPGLLWEGEGRLHVGTIEHWAAIDLASKALVRNLPFPRAGWEPTLDQLALTPKRLLGAIARPEFDPGDDEGPRLRALVHVWGRTMFPKLQRSLCPDQGQIRALGALDRSLWVLSQKGLSRFDLATGQRLGRVAHAQILPGSGEAGGKLLVADATGSLTRYDPVTLRAERLLTLPPRSYRLTDVQPETGRALTQSEDGVLRLWDLRKGQLLREIRPGGQGVFWGRDHALVVTTDPELCPETIRQVDLSQGAVVKSATLAHRPRLSADASGATVLAELGGEASGQLALLDATLHLKQLGHSRPFDALAISPSGQRFASANHDAILVRQTQ